MQNQNIHEQTENKPSEAKPTVDTSHLLDGAMTGPAGNRGDVQKSGSDSGVERNTKPISTDSTNTYKVPPAEQQFQAIKSYGDDTMSSGNARTLSLNLADGSSVKALDAFDRSTGQHTYIVQNPENGSVTSYKPVDGKTLQAVDRDGKPTGDQLAVKPNQIVMKDSQNDAAKNEGTKPAEQAKGEAQPVLKGEVSATETRGAAKQAEERADAKGSESSHEKGHGGHAEKGHDKHQENGHEKGHEHGHGKGHEHHGHGHRQIDGKLLAQLQSLGRSKEQRSDLLESINKFQDGKLSDKGKEGGLNSVFQGMKENLDGLKAWLTDGKKNPFDFKQLDDKTQQNLSKAFDTMLVRDQGKTNAMLDLNGMRNVITDGNLTPSRNLGADQTQTNFTLSARELGSSLQSMIDRMQIKEQSVAIQDRTLSTKQDSKDGDSKPGVKLSESAIDAITKAGAIGRGLGEKKAEDSILNTKTIAQPNPDQVKENLAEQKELEEAKQKKLAEQEMQEQQEKDKQEEKKKQADEERLYIVMENDTLNSISKKFFQKTDNAEIIYDRNLDGIMLHEYKGVTYAKLYPRQRIIIPNTQYIDNFRGSNKSHKQISFDKIPFSSAGEELEQMFGKNWSGPATESVLGNRPSESEDDAPINRRSFSGNSAPLTDTTRRANVQAALGLNASAASQSGKYNVHLGESLRSIAQKFYKSPSYWRLLALKNNLSTETDPRGNPTALLRRGQQIILPDQSEVDAFLRDSSSPVVVALSSDELGMLSPRSRVCGYCTRETLAMAVNCVSCGAEMNSYVPQEDDGAEQQNQRPAAILNALQNVVDQVATVQLQDVTLTNKFQQLNFSPERGQRQEQTAVQVLHPQPPHDRHPLPTANLAKVEFGFEEETGEDPMWTAEIEPVTLDQFVQIVEAETMEGDRRGIVVTLQLYSQGQWLVVFDYHVFPDVVVIHKYQRKGGRRMMKKSLPAKQAKQMSWSHFRSNWQAICNEYWASV